MASSRIKKSDVEKLLNTKREEYATKLSFINKVKKSLQIENQKLSELEGAILALQEILPKEKVIS